MTNAPVGPELEQYRGDRSGPIGGHSSGGQVSDHGGDGGFVMVVMGLAIVPLLIVTAFAIDLGAWYAQGAKMQRTADAASLAGVVWAGDATMWDTVAREVATRNGFTNGAVGTAVTVNRVSESQIGVQIARNGEQYFSKIVLSSVRLQREAVAEYIIPVPMGSPENALANDPARGFAPNFWLNIAGVATDKVSGDRHTAGTCGGGFGCNTSLGLRNTEYRPDGYFFRVGVKALPGTALNIQAYDPAFVYQNDTCGTNGPSAAQYTTLQTQYPGDAARYQAGNTPYCSGDQNLNGANIRTTYIVRAPDGTPLDDTDNPAICAITFDPYDQNVFGLLDTTVPANLLPRGTENVRFSNHFHKYFTLCQVPAADVALGDYIVQVRTNADLTTDPPSTTVANTALVLGSAQNAASPLPSTGGHNRFALRAGFGTPPTSAASAAWSTGVSVFASGRLPIYVNTGATVSTTQFFLARITPQYAAKTLQLNFWDIGDVSSGGHADFTVITPTDALNPPTACQFTRDGGAMPSTVTISGCTVQNMTNAQFNGRLTQANIALPATYSCDSGSDTGCWFKVSLTIDGSPTDTTTWSANILGDPVHLVD